MSRYHIRRSLPQSDVAQDNTGAAASVPQPPSKPIKRFSKAWRNSNLPRHGRFLAFFLAKTTSSTPARRNVPGCARLPAAELHHVRNLLHSPVSIRELNNQDQLDCLNRTGRAAGIMWCRIESGIACNRASSSSLKATPRSELGFINGEIARQVRRQWPLVKIKLASRQPTN